MNDTEQPERIWIRPINPHRPLGQLYTNRDMAASKVNEDSVEYVRADRLAQVEKERDELRDNMQRLGRARAREIEQL